MADHVQPTTEELQANIQKTQEEIEKLSTTPPVEETEEEEVVEDKSETKEEKPEDDKEEVVEEKTEDKEEEQTDYKKKFVDSAREARVLHAKTKKMDEAIAEADALAEPTDDELQTEARIKGFDLEDMTNVEKSLFKSSILNERKLAKISEVAKEGKDVEAWNTKVDTYIEDPKTLIDNPDLEGKVDDFKYFATKATRRGVAFEDLVSAFLFEQSKSKVKHKGKMFETGNGGPVNKQVDDKISVQESRVLRDTNYEEYKRQLRAGKIKTDI